MQQRLEPLEPERLSGRQAALLKEIAGTRGKTVGPFSVWLRTPDIAAAANQLGNALRLGGALDRRLFEIAILVVARHWGAEYAFVIHDRDARAAGVSGDVIEAIRGQKEPLFEREDEQLVHKIAAELFETKMISDATYAMAVDTLGVEQLIELLTTIGFYTTASIIVNAFRIPPPEGGSPLAP